MEHHEVARIGDGTISGAHPLSSLEASYHCRPDKVLTTGFAELPMSNSSCRGQVNRSPPSNKAAPRAIVVAAMPRRPIDDDAALNLAERVRADFGGALVTTLGYIGHRLGLFQAMVESGPLTSPELSGRAGLNERYVREWLSAMVAAQYIDYEPQTETFGLSPEQESVLADARSPFDMVGTFLYAQACIRQLPALIEAFKYGGGVPFSDFGPEVIEGIERMFQVGYETSVASQWIPAVSDIHARLTSGGEVAEVGCGAGQCLIPVASVFPNSRFVGYDVDRPSIERARRKAAAADLGQRVSFEVRAAEDLPSGQFDLMMAFNCIHDMVDPRRALAGVRGALKPKGAFLWSEAAASDRIEENITPMGRVLYAASLMHCMTVSLAHGGEGLGTVVGEEMARTLAQGAGFSTFEVLPVQHPFHRVFLLRP